MELMLMIEYTIPLFMKPFKTVHEIIDILISHGSKKIFINGLILSLIGNFSLISGFLLIERNQVFASAGFLVFFIFSSLLMHLLIIFTSLSLILFTIMLTGRSLDWISTAGFYLWTDCISFPVLPLSIIFVFLGGSFKIIWVLILAVVLIISLVLKIKVLIIQAKIRSSRAFFLCFIPAATCLIFLFLFVLTGLGFIIRALTV